MQFRISEMVEKFRTLMLYKENVDPAVLEQAFSLEQKWKELVSDAKHKDSQLDVNKQKFAKETQLEVLEFKKALG